MLLLDLYIVTFFCVCLLSLWWATVLATQKLTQILYLEATEEVSLDSPERDPVLSPEPTPAITPVTPTTLVAPRMESKSGTAPASFDRSREEVYLKFGVILFGLWRLRVIFFLFCLFILF